VFFARGRHNIPHGAFVMWRRLVEMKDAKTIFRTGR
jgi:hypothetical protein